MIIDQTQQRIRTFTGTYVNPESEVYPVTLLMCDTAEYIVKRIMQATGCRGSRIIVHVQRNVISFEDTLEYAIAYGKLPLPEMCEEIYMLGWDNWYRLNELF